MSHPQNPLKLTCCLNLLNEELICPGCSGNIQTSRVMAYYCASCIFIMNRQCAGAPKTLTRVDNVSYELFFEFPFKNENAEIKCNICSKKAGTKGGLLYYNLEHDEALQVYCAIKK
ncbi:hypothetical protein R3W88_032157 [Solanum pinnatisectum]|uniref:DC1 domain-containing protein n=1 Tax=Solanum pinnatisectum TaxID=50273 RepID=A0AAV9LNC0_9SOLN|nr:hypothetical protein R3W88_032157 [Solanum pinnatisectum]